MIDTDKVNLILEFSIRGYIFGVGEASPEELKKDLKKVKPTSIVIDIIIKAIKGYYHDYLSPLPFPKHILESDLRKAGLNKLADEVIKGRYD